MLVQLSTRVPRELRRRVRLVCVEQGRDLQDFIAEAIREYLRRRQVR
jgi:predicted DNA-binding protein